jgi:glycolate oxidase
MGGSRASAEESWPATMSATVIAALRDVIAPERIVDDPDIVASYAHDRAEWATAGTALVVVRPRSTEEVRAVVATCARLRVPVVTRGAGTGLSGGANAVDGCVVLSLEAMNDIVEIDEVEQLAVVQPGVINDDLRAACAQVGLWYPPDPASSPWSTIGGNAATNAGGLCCVKYGVTRDYVLALEVVTGRGEVVRLGRRTAKGVAGYDLCSLMVGSEGTLGVITEVTVRLRAARPAEQTVVAYFETLADAGRATAAVLESGVVPSALELIDRACLQAVDAWKNMDLADAGNVLLLARSDAPGLAGDAEAATILASFEKEGATWAARSTNQQEADALFEARRLAYPAMERLGPVLTEDVCVPRRAIAAMLERIEVIARECDTRIATIAHAGDGNLHPLILVPADDADAPRRAQLAFDRIISDALALGGTVTGEHGVGLLKRAGLQQELSSEVLLMHRAIKDALDPAGILNPGKVIPLVA